MPQKYKLFLTDDFEKSFDSLDKLKQKATIKKLTRFQENPIRFSHKLEGPLKGKRSIEVLSDLRIVVSICEWCRKEEWEKYNGCINCEKAPPNAIIIWGIGSHKIYNHLSQSKKKFTIQDEN